VTALRAMARGDGAGMLAAGEELARAVLDAPQVRAALAVLEGGPAAEARIAELAEAVLSQSSTAGRSSGTGGSR
jgi:predicted nicotinamide N-methyase